MMFEVAPLDHSYVYPGDPPDEFAVITPSAAPKHEIDCDVRDNRIAGGFTSVNEKIDSHEFASVMLTA